MNIGKYLIKMEIASAAIGILVGLTGLTSFNYLANNNVRAENEQRLEYKDASGLLNRVVLSIDKKDGEIEFQEVDGYFSKRTIIVDMNSDGKVDWIYLSSGSKYNTTDLALSYSRDQDFTSQEALFRKADAKLIEALRKYNLEIYLRKE